MEITRIDGRKDEATEFVEFRENGKNIRYVAQRGASGHWFVFQVGLGPKGTVKTLADFQPSEKDLAVAKALNSLTSKGAQ